MNARISTAIATALSLAALALAGCQSGPAGTYKLDKGEMKKAMEAEIAKLPAEQQAMSKLALGLIEAMDMTLELKGDGKLEMKATMPEFKEGAGPKTETSSGEWKADGNKVTLSADKKDMTCELADKKLTCTPGKPGEPSLVFNKS